MHLKTCFIEEDMHLYAWIYSLYINNHKVFRYKWYGQSFFFFPLAMICYSPHLPCDQKPRGSTLWLVEKIAYRLSYEGWGEGRFYVSSDDYTTHNAQAITMGRYSSWSLQFFIKIVLQFNQHEQHLAYPKNQQNIQIG